MEQAQGSLFLMMVGQQSPTIANSNSHLASVNERIQKIKIEEIVMTKVKVEMIASRQR